jgi:hypothetical protein
MAHQPFWVFDKDNAVFGKISRTARSHRGKALRVVKLFLPKALQYARTKRCALVKP